MNNLKERIKNTRLLAAIGIACMILGTMLSYVSYDIFGYKYEISLWDYFEGKIILIIAIANLLFIFKDLVEKYVPAVFDTKIGSKIKNINNPKASLVPTFIGAAFAIYLTVHLDIDFTNYSLGFYSLWIGVISLVVYSFIYKNNSNQE